MRQLSLSRTPAEVGGDFEQGAVEHVCRGHNQKHVLREEPEEHACGGHEQDYQARAAARPAHGLKTRIANGAHHQRSEHSDEGDHQPAVDCRLVRVPDEERQRVVMDDRREQTRRGGDGQPDEALLVEFRRAFEERARARGLHVETCQPEGPT